jgi:hypothetical protein
MTHLNHTNSRADVYDSVVAAYIHEISTRHASMASGRSAGNGRIGATRERRPSGAASARTRAGDRTRSARPRLCV